MSNLTLNTENYGNMFIGMKICLLLVIFSMTFNILQPISKIKFVQFGLWGLHCWDCCTFILALFPKILTALACFATQIFISN